MKLSRPAILTLAILTVVVGASMVVARDYSRRAVVETLQNRAESTREVFLSFLPATFAPMQALAALQGAQPMEADDFAAAADALVDLEFASLAVLEPGPDGAYEPLLLAGRSLRLPPDADRQPPAIAVPGEPRILDVFANGGRRVIPMVVDVPDSDQRVYQELTLEIGAEDAAQFSAWFDFDFELYLGQEATHQNLVIATSTDPLAEPQVRAPLEDPSTHTIFGTLIVAERQPLTPWATRHLALLVLLLGALVGGVLTGMSEAQHRRRRRAERLADDLAASTVQLAKAEGDARSAEERLRSVIKSSPDVLVGITAGSDEVQFFNADAEDWDGRGQRLEVMLATVEPNDRAEVERAIAVLRDGEDDTPRTLVVHTLATAAEGPGQYRVRLTVLHPGGEAHAREILATVSDITEAMQASEARKRYERMQAQSHRLEAIGQLAGGVAHDFNNILGAVLGTAEMMMEDLQDTPHYGDAELIRDAANSAAALTQQLLVFSRRDVITPEPVDMADVARSTTALLQRTLGEAVSINLEAHDSELWVVADRTEMEQVLVNLAINARDAMPDGGDIHIRLQRSTGSGTGTAEQPTCWLVVSDTGVGIPEEDQDHIFEPFFTTKERGRGTGLGLATVYGIVTRWGGRIEVASRVGNGSSFMIWLPLADPHVAPTHPGEVAGRSRELASGSILVVEDEVALRLVTERILRRAGYDVVTASDGPTALEDVDLDGIDLVLTDVVMPGGLNGPELAALVRQRRPDVPVLFMSGYGDDVISHRGIVRSGTTLLPKPFNESTLLSSVRSALEA